MDTSGQAAEAIVKYSIEGMEYTLKVAGRGAERLAAALLALSRSQQKTKGKTTLNALLKSQKELKVFTIPEKRLKDFARRRTVLRPEGETIFQKWSVRHSCPGRRCGKNQSHCGAIGTKSDSCGHTGTSCRTGDSAAGHFGTGTPGCGTSAGADIVSAPTGAGKPYCRPDGTILSVRAWLQAQRGGY